MSSHEWQKIAFLCQKKRGKDIEKKKKKPKSKDRKLNRTSCVEKTLRTFTFESSKPKTVKGNSQICIKQAAFNRAH